MAVLAVARVAALMDSGAVEVEAGGVGELVAKVLVVAAAVEVVQARLASAGAMAWAALKLEEGS